MLPTTRDARPVPGTRRWTFEITSMIWGILVGLFVYRWLAPKLILILHYGWDRVMGQGLAVVEIEYEYHLGYQDWTLSTGETLRIQEFEHDFAALPAWAVIMAMTVPIIWLIVRRSRGGAE